MVASFLPALIPLGLPEPMQISYILFKNIYFGVYSAALIQEIYKSKNTLDKSKSNYLLFMNFEFDTRLLTCFSTKPLPEPVEENHLHSRAGEAFFKLFKVVADLKRKENEGIELTTEDLRIMDYSKSPFEVTLEDQKTIFPRFKKYVKETVIPTRWEAFAKEKGIQKKKRSRKVFDESTQDWVPRWGANSVKKLEEKRNIIVEENKGEPQTDPFARKYMEKHLQAEKHKLREEKNNLRKIGEKAKSSYTDRLADRKKKVKKVLDIGPSFISF